MNVPRHIRQAARMIRRVFIVPYRRRKLMRAAGVDDFTTNFDVAKKCKKASEPTRSKIQAGVHGLLAKEIGRARGKARIDA